MRLLGERSNIRLGEGGISSVTARNILTLTSGAVQAQAILIIASPVLTRLYSPELFGYLGLFTSLSAVLAVILSGSYERGILIVKEKEEATALYRLAMVVSVVWAIGLTLLLLVFGADVATAMGKPGFTTWLYLVPLTGMLTAHYQILLCAGNRQLQYSPIARAQIWQSASSVLSQILAAFVGLTTVGLLFGFILGKLSCALSLILGLRRYGNELIGRMASKMPSMRATAAKHWRFPVFNSSTALVDVLSLQAAILIAARAYPLEAVGYFSLAQRVIGMPLVMIGVGIGEIFFERASRRIRMGASIRSLLWKVVAGLTVVALPIALILLLYGPELFAFVFGDRWAVSGEYARILIFVFLGRFIISPIANIFVATNTLGILAIMRSAYFIVIFGLLLHYSRYLTVEDFIILYTVIESIRYVVFLAAAHFVSAGTMYKPV